MKTLENLEVGDLVKNLRIKTIRAVIFRTETNSGYVCEDEDGDAEFWSAKELKRHDYKPCVEPSIPEYTMEEKKAIKLLEDAGKLINGKILN